MGTEREKEPTPALGERQGAEAERGQGATFARRKSSKGRTLRVHHHTPNRLNTFHARVEDAVPSG